MEKHTPHILVLGANGFVGHTIFSFLSSHYQTIGTSRSKKTQNLVPFTVENSKRDFASIQKSMKTITHVINCIGVYKNTSKEHLVQVNAMFPHQLEQLIPLYNFKLIHISTDAIFGRLQGTATETTTPFPDTIYGMSKLLGETEHKNALTIRTSLIGTDRYNKKGIIESILSSAKQIDGYANQAWSGCTTLQFAKLCSLLTDNKTFEHIRIKSTHIHFAPLPKITKYALVKKIVKNAGLSLDIKKVKKEKTTRVLTSLYTNISPIKQFNPSYEKALQKILALR